MTLDRHVVAGGGCSDGALLEPIRAIIEVSPFSGEGYCKVWARRRAQGGRTAARRMRRIMKAHTLAPQRPGRTPVQRDAHPHDSATATERVDQVYGTVMAHAVTIGDGRGYVFIAVDHGSGECVGAHASSSASRWEALAPIRQGLARHFGGVGPDTAVGLILRHDHGLNAMSDDFQDEIKCFGLTRSPAQIPSPDPQPSAPALVRQPEGEGVAERAICTLTAPPLYIRRLATLDGLRQALATFTAQDNASWIRQRHGARIRDQIRTDPKALATEAATGTRMARDQRNALSYRRAAVHD
jgi:hypothetical protein